MTSPTKIKSYRDLVAWQHAYQVGLEVYRLTREFPSDERFGLVNQMRRAGISIASNIAEGYGRGGRADYARMLKVARGSLYELETQTSFAADLGFLSRPDTEALQAKLDDLSRLLNGLIRAIESPPST